MENHTWKTMFSNSKLGFFIAMLHIYSTGICIPITGPWRKKQTLQVISAIPRILWLKQITYKVVPSYKLAFRTGAPCTRVPFRTPNTPRTAQGPSHRWRPLFWCHHSWLLRGVQRPWRRFKCISPWFRLGKGFDINYCQKNPANTLRRSIDHQNKVIIYI